ncbi:hypothetical protein [Lysinibacillus sphaericus]|nr:hypothetical protein [Lysinibacillus sphaericus]
MGTSHASDNLSNSKITDGSQVKVSITNDESGKTTYLEPIVNDNLKWNMFGGKMVVQEPGLVLKFK